MNSLSFVREDGTFDPVMFLINDTDTEINLTAVIPVVCLILHSITVYELFKKYIAEKIS